MKALILTLLFTVSAICVYSQSVLPLRADTVVVEKVGGNANLRVKDASRDSTGGVYVNIGGGVFRAIKTKKLNDTSYIIGLDTIRFHSGATAIDSGIFATNYRVDTAKVNIRSLIATKLNISDTTNKWINSIRRRSGTDTVEFLKNGVWQFAYKDSVGMSITLSNVGSSYRLVKTATGQIKSIAVGFGVKADSTTNTDAITFYVDTISTNRIVTQAQLRDTAIALRLAMGGGSQNLQQVTDIGHITTNPIEADSGIFNNGVHMRRNARVGATTLSVLQPFPVFGSSITVGYGSTSWATLISNKHIQTSVTNNAVNGSGISTATPNNIHSKISLFPNYTSNTFAVAFDAGINDFILGADTNVYKAQLGEIIDSFKVIRGFPNARILILSPPYSPAFKGDSIYIGINQRVVNAHGGTAIDIWHPMAYAYTHGHTDIIQSDSLHPADGGQEIIANTVAFGTNSTIGSYYGNFVKTGSDTTYKDSYTYGNSTVNGKIFTYGSITQSTVNGGAIRILHPGRNNGDIQDLRFVPDIDYHGSGIKDSFMLRHIINNSYQSEFGFYRKSDATLFRGWYLNANVQLLLGTDAPTPPTTDYTSSLGAAYIYSAYVPTHLKVVGDGISDAQRIGVYRNGFDVAAIGFNATYGLQMGSSHVGTTFMDISSVDGVTPTVVAHIPHNNTGHLLVGNGITDNGSNATLQVKGKFSVSQHAIGSSSDSAITWNRSTQEYEVAKINTATDGNGIYSGSGSLPGAVTITGAGNALTMTGTQGSTAAFNVNNTGNGIAISGTTTGTGAAGSFSNSSSGAGLFGSSSSGFGGNFTSITGIGLRSKVTPSSTNTVVDVTNWIRGTSGTAAVGMGIGLPLKLTDDAGNDITTARFTSVFTDATTASPDADFNILTITAGSLTNKFSIKNTGQLQWSIYTSSNFVVNDTTSYKPIVVDASGNIHRMLGWPVGAGGSGITSLNSQTGATQTFTQGTGITISSSSDNHTIGLNSSYITSGTYTPTSTNTTNVTTSTPTQCQYMRVGDVVTVSGRIFIDATATGLIEVQITLPISSDFGNDYDAAGTIDTDGTNAQHGVIKADATNNRAVMAISGSSSSGYDYSFHFTYRII